MDLNQISKFKLKGGCIFPFALVFASSSYVIYKVLDVESRKSILKNRILFQKNLNMINIIHCKNPIFDVCLEKHLTNLGIENYSEKLF